MLGSTLTKDFAVISLSDNLSEKEDTTNRIIAAAKTNFGIVFYSPHNSTYNNLLLAREILSQYRKFNTIVGIVKNIGTANEEVLITTLETFGIKYIDSFTTIFIGRSDTKILNSKVKNDYAFVLKKERL